MECQEFIVLYTHQKMKKSKVWQDGVLKTTHLGNKFSNRQFYMMTKEHVWKACFLSALR